MNDFDTGGSTLMHEQAESSDGSQFLPSPTEFATIVQRAQAGNPNDFVSLKNFYEGSLLSYLKKIIGDEEIAQDLLSETVLRAWKNISTTNEQLRLWSKMKKWWFTIATNLVRDYWRCQRQLKTISLEFLEERYQEGKPSSTKDATSFQNRMSQGTEELVCLNEQVTNMKEALKLISPQQRTCFYLKDVEGLSHKEIAQRLGITESCTRAYAARGRLQFLRALARIEKYGVLEKEKGTNS